MTASEKIVRLCEERLWTLPRLATAAGIKYTTLRNYVGKSARTPPVDNAIRIAEALGTDVRWLFDDSFEWKHRPPSVQRPGMPQPTESQIAQTLEATIADKDAIFDRMSAVLREMIGDDGIVSGQKRDRWTMAQRDELTRAMAWAGLARTTYRSLLHSVWQTAKRLHEIETLIHRAIGISLGWISSTDATALKVLHERLEERWNRVAAVAPSTPDFPLEAPPPVDRARRQGRPKRKK